MPYTPISITQGVTAVNATFGNFSQTQYTEATLSFGPDAFTVGFVLTGYTPTGTVGTTTLNVAAGTAYVLQADGTTRQRKLTSSTQTTSALSTTYFLYLQPDGTWFWSTTNAPATNSLAIATVTTNGSGQIATVTDARGLNATLLPNMAGKLTLPTLNNTTVSGTLGVTGAVTLSSTLALTGTSIINGYATFQNGTNDTPGIQFYDGANNTTSDVNMQGERWRMYGSYRGGASRELMFMDISAGKLNLTIGGMAQVAGQTTAGSFGVPVIVAQAIQTNVTVTTLQNIISYTPTVAGFFRISASFSCNNGGTNKPLLHLDFTGGSHGTTSSVSMTSPTGAVLDGVATTVVANFDNPTTPQTVYCAANAAIILRYQNSTGTPNDFISYLIERLA